MRRFLSSCAALLLLPAFLAAGPPMTALTITVTNTSDKPIENASVIVKFLKTSKVIKIGHTHTEWEMRTGQEGAVKIPPVPQGRILVQVIAKNYQTFGQTFDVDEPEKTLAIRLNPPQPQYSAH